MNKMTTTLTLSAKDLVDYVMNAMVILKGNVVDITHVQIALIIIFVMNVIRMVPINIMQHKFQSLMNQAFLRMDTVVHVACSLIQREDGLKSFIANTVRIMPYALDVKGKDTTDITENTLIELP